MRIVGKIISKYPCSKQLPNGATILIVREKSFIVTDIWCGTVKQDYMFVGFHIQNRHGMLQKTKCFLPYQLMPNETLYEITDISFNILKQIRTYQDFLKVFDEEIIILNKLYQ